MSAIDINLVDISTFTKKRKRPIAACARCHERKVRCDAGTYRKFQDLPILTSPGRSPNGGPCKASPLPTNLESTLNDYAELSHRWRELSVRAM